MHKFVWVIMIVLSFGLNAQEVKQDSTENKQKINIKERPRKPVKKKETTENGDTKILKGFHQRSNPPRKKPLPIRIYPEKSSGDLVEFGWEQFKEEKYKHAAECFQELVTRKDSLADAYLGLGWSKLMLYRPIEETRIIKSSDYVKNREFYILKPNEFLELYSEEDECPNGWVDNAIKLNDNGDPVHTLPKENMPVYDWDWFPIMLYISDSIETVKWDDKLKAKEINSESDLFYNFRRVWVTRDNDEYCIYNNKFGFIKIFDELIDKLIGDFDDFVIGASYLRALRNTLYWTDSIEITRQNTNNRNLLFDLSRKDSTSVKIVKRKTQTQSTDTWNYQVFNLYDFSGDVYHHRNHYYLLNEEEFSIDIYSVEEDGTKNHIVPGTDKTYLEYLRLDTNNDGVVDGFDTTINLEENWIRFPFIKPFAGLSNENIYIKEPAIDNDNIEISLNLRYVDFNNFFKISRAFADMSKYIDTDNNTYLAGESFRWLITKRYNACIASSSILIKHNWFFDNNPAINYKDLIILRAYSFFQLAKYEGSLIEIQRLVPDFSPDITNENGVKELQRKIEELINMLEIQIK